LRSRPRRHGLNAVNPLGKLPGSVWTIPTEPLKVPDHLGVDHFAAFPTAWPRKIISAWAPEGGTVLDPFGGTGTTAMVAKALGRHGISVDMSADYCRLAEWRTNDRNQLAKVLGIEKTERRTRTRWTSSEATPHDPHPRRVPARQP
jgi:DNA modification methylase